MKRFFNSRETIVTEGLDGVILAAGPGRLARLDGYPHIKVVLRADWTRDRVAVISGGGAGHEPAHAGFVGPGMLTAAVSGEIFASPSVEAVLAAMLAVTGPAGCLLVVKNYTGDRLNFGLAAERAKRLGLRVEVVIVADDIALPGAAQPRGVAGTLFVHKLAGHLAEEGRSLEEVAGAARAAAGSIYSLGVSLSTCTIPGQRPEARHSDDEMEVGLGIHGEPGAERTTLRGVREIVALMVERLSAALPPGEASYALLLNNLGSVPALEMSVIAYEVARSPLAARVGLWFGPAPLMTSLDMNGFSLSLLALTEERKEALLSPVEIASWPRGVALGEVARVALPAGLVGAPWVASEEAQTRAMIHDAAHGLLAREAELNALDAKVGDGDTGSTLAGAARAVLAQLEKLPLAEPAALCGALGDILSRSMGGSSGVLLSIFFTAAGESLASSPGWAAALAAGAARVQFYGGASAGDRTLLDALLPAVAALQQGGGLRSAAQAAQHGAEATAGMAQAKAGRSAYVPGEHLAGVQDPGAAAVAAVFGLLAHHA
jgi:dihydroxyacetone kinase